jgi:porphobilinogen synthase
MFFPNYRPRRMRKDIFSRNLLQENHLHAHKLIYPIFIVDGVNQQQKISSMPNVRRYSLDRVLRVCETAIDLGIQTIALFPVIENQLKDAQGSMALDSDGLVPRAIKHIKTRFPELGIIADIALDPYTSHGQDGLIDENGHVINDATVSVLEQQACLYAHSGADIVAPSDMMDGRVLAIRNILERNNFIDTKILAYAAKYCSAFYGPFRDAVGSKAKLGKYNKKSYQMHPANAQEALREASLDISEGADMIMVKPGLPYLDVIRMLKDRLNFPTFAYHVSGEYAMLHAAAQNGWLDYNATLVEIMYSFMRAGADGVLSYAALELAQLIKDNYDI